MNKFYYEFKNRLTKNGQLGIFLCCSSYFETFLSRVSEEEMYNILNYDRSTFKKYIDFIFELYNQRKLDNNIKIIHELTKIIFNTATTKYNKAPTNGKLLKDLILSTDIIYNKNILSFAREFMLLSDDNAINVYNAVLNNNNKLSLMKLVTYFSYLRNKIQSDTMERLFKIPGIFKHPNFYEFIELIINNSNARYLDYIPDALYNVYLFEDRDCYQLVSLFLKVKTDKQANLLLKILENKYMLESCALNDTINYLFDDKNVRYLKYLNFAVDLKQDVSDYRFSLLIDLYNKAGKDEYKIRGLTDLFKSKHFLTYENSNLREYLDDCDFNLVANYILKTKDKFQVTSIISVIKNIKRKDIDNIYIKLFLDKIIESKKEFQADLIADFLENIVTDEHLYKMYFNSYNDKNHYENKVGEILNLIVNIKDSNACNCFMFVVSNQHVINNDDYINIIKKYLNLNDSKKYEYFCDMIRKIGLLDYNNYLAFDCLKIANWQQAILIHEVIMETNIYLNKTDYELIKYLLATKDRKVLFYITAVIYNCKILGYERSKKEIEKVLNNPQSIYNPNNNKFVMKIFNDFLVKNETFTDKIGKVLKKEHIN